jgi:hypothetical protein
VSEHTQTTLGLDALDLALERITHDVGLVVDRHIDLDAHETRVMQERPAGQGQVHLSFRLSVDIEGVVQQGSLLMPLEHANGLAASLMMMAEPQVDEVRSSETPDRATKDAMVELGCFVAGAITDQLTETLTQPVLVVPAGCQGVRPGVRPALKYTDGNDLWVAQANCSIGTWEEGPWILMLPDLTAAV